MGARTSIFGIPIVVFVIVIFAVGSPFYTVFMLSRASNISLQEAQQGAMCQTRHIDDFIYQHYNGGLILNNQGPNEFEAGSAGIDFKNVIYQGSGQYWTDALAHPERIVQWIVINPYNPQDIITQHINIRSDAFNTNFELVVMQSSGAMLFHRRGLPPLPNRPAMPQYSYPHYPCQ